MLLDMAPRDLAPPEDRAPRPPPQDEGPGRLSAPFYTGVTGRPKVSLMQARDMLAEASVIMSEVSRAGIMISRCAKCSFIMARVDAHLAYDEGRDIVLCGPCALDDDMSGGMMFHKERGAREGCPGCEAESGQRDLWSRIYLRRELR